MRKTLLFSVIAIFAMLFTVSCTRDDSILTLDAQNHAIEKSDHSVSVENALKYLEGDLAMIDPEETRATQPRIVKSVKHVPFKSVRSTTRAAADAPNDISDLLYLVEFEDGRGSAVLGADDRIEPVLAVLDESVLTIDDFTATDNNGDISKYVASLIKEAATSMIYNSPIGDDIQLIRSNEFDTINIVKQTPLLKTKWGQSCSPFNYYSQDSLGVKCPAGCGPIAISQIIASNHRPDTLIINGVTINWDAIEQYYYCNYNQYFGEWSEETKQEVGRFIYEVGQCVNVDYNINGSSSSLSLSPEAIKTIGGYKTAQLELYTYEKAYNMVYENKLPFYMYGVDEQVEDPSAHAWVIDGLNSYDVNVWLIETPPVNIPGRIIRTLISTINHWKVHCNFGWMGKCDGYYTHNIFDTTIALPDEDKERDYGDHGPAISTDNDGSYKYTRNLKMITYELD